MSCGGNDPSAAAARLFHMLICATKAVRLSPTFSILEQAAKYRVVNSLDVVSPRSRSFEDCGSVVSLHVTGSS